MNKGLKKKEIFPLFIIVLTFFTIQIPNGASYKTDSRDIIKFDTHFSILVEAKNVLIADGYSVLSSGGYWFGQYVEGFYHHFDDLHRGSMEYDLLGQAIEHFHDPYTKEGLWGINKSGWDYCQENFDTAVQNYKKGSYDDSFEFLGRSIHIVQDLTVPHHARLTNLNGHMEYEASCCDNPKASHIIDNVNFGGIYDLSNENSAKNYADYASFLSYSYYSYVNGIDGDGNNNYSIAFNYLLPYAVKLTAGLIKLFYEVISANFEVQKFLVQSEPITLLGNNWSSSEVVTGNGTMKDPYLIANLKIDASGSDWGIRIENSLVSAIIKNCTIINGKMGISLNNSTNCKVIDNLIFNNSVFGISIDRGLNCSISENAVYNNSNGGIYLYNTSSCIVNKNIVTNNQYDGIAFNFSQNCFSSGNFVRHNLKSGFRLENSINCLVINNLLTRNLEYGIILCNSSRNNSIFSNQLTKNFMDSILNYQITNEIHSNLYLARLNVSFIIQESPINVSKKVGFTDLSITSYLPVQYYWDLGDGAISLEQNASHIYTRSGNYSVSLTVTDFEGESSFKHLNIQVFPSSVPNNTTTISINTSTDSTSTTSNSDNSVGSNSTSTSSSQARSNYIIPGFSSTIVGMCSSIVIIVALNGRKDEKKTKI